MFNTIFECGYFPDAWSKVLIVPLLNQSTDSTAKRLAYLIALTIDTLHNTINDYEITCIWNSKYNIHVCMIQTNADFIFQKLIVFVSF